MSIKNLNTSDEFILTLTQHLQNDHIHGASELAREALKGLSVYANLLKEQNTPDYKEKLIALARHLCQIRPSMTPVENLVGRWLTHFNKCQSQDISVLQSAACHYAEKLENLSHNAMKQAAKNTLPLISPGMTLMTHSLSSTITTLFHLIAEQKIPIKTIITASEPSLEGKKLAQLLSKLEIPTTYITDAQIGLFIKQADMVITGADTITEEGELINKSGTYLLALAAADAGIPFYACSESFKKSTKKLNAIELEEMTGDELKLSPLPYISVRNIYFDATPSRLVKGWVTEEGVMKSLNCGLS